MEVHEFIVTECIFVDLPNNTAEDSLFFPFTYIAFLSAVISPVLKSILKMTPSLPGVGQVSIHQFKQEKNDITPDLICSLPACDVRAKAWYYCTPPLAMSCSYFQIFEEERENRRSEKM